MVTVSNKNISIGVFGHYGNDNLGDEAIITAMFQNLKLRFPNATFYGLSINPNDTSERYNINAYPIRQHCGQIVSKPNKDEKKIAIEKSKNTSDNKLKSVSNIKRIIKRIPLVSFIFKVGSHFLYLISELLNEIMFLVQSYRNMRKLDALLITGSNQFMDHFGGPWGFPYTLFKWSLLARLARKKVFFISIGANPIEHNLSKYFIKLAIMLSCYTSFRDDASQTIIKSLGYHGETFVYPDVAHSLDYPVPIQNEAADINKERKSVVGINPMPLYDSRYWCVHDDEKYKIYVNKLVEFCSWLIEQDHPIFFFATQPKDKNVINDVLAELDVKEKNVNLDGIVKNCQTVNELMDVMASADIAVTTRFHGTLLALHSERPVLGVCYYRKTDDLIRSFWQGRYSIESEVFHGTR